MISQTAEYALRAVAWLAEHHGPGASPRTVADIAAVTGMPPEYLSKVMQELTRAGLAASQRGPAGGFRLARDPHDISVLDVVQAVNPLPRIHECPLHRADHATELCALHRLLDDAVAGVEDAFRRATIADLLTTGRGTAMRCVQEDDAKTSPNGTVSSPSISLDTST
jgi:Rrf2 family nitric oxide-sensitive transcriptional repressor